MRISPEVEIALSLANNEAARRRHEYITIEHLLYALLFDDATALIVKHAGGDVGRLKKELERFLDEQLEQLSETDAISTSPLPSIGVQRAIREVSSRRFALRDGHNSMGPWERAFGGNVRGRHGNELHERERSDLRLILIDHLFRGYPGIRRTSVLCRKML